jgi:WhiB family redox-sensing transcriptional regulator
LPDLTGAACAGRSDLFDLAAGSRHHREALALCARCPVLTACRAWFASLPSVERPLGVIAGRVHTRPGPSQDQSA